MNPFDDPSGRFRVLVNRWGQYALWPLDSDVPAGWETVRTGLGHQEAVEHVDVVWTDLRPTDARRATGPA